MKTMYLVFARSKSEDFKLIAAHFDYGLLMWDITRLQDRYYEILIRSKKK